MTSDEWAKALLRERDYRWSAQGKARVTHPQYGTVIVPSGSNFSAVLCAAEVWNCDWSEIMDASVTMCDQSLKAENRYQYRKEFMEV